MFEAFLAFFIIGAGFWIVSILLMLFIAAACYEGIDDPASGAWASVWLVILGIFLWGTTGTSPIEWFKSHSWPELLGYAGGYIVSGFSWSLFKWRAKIKKWAIAKRERLAASKEVTGKPVELNGDSYRNRKPELQRHVDDVTFWLVFWPFSVLAYAIGEWLVDLLDWIGTQLMKLKKVYRWVEGSYGDE